MLFAWLVPHSLRAQLGSSVSDSLYSKVMQPYIDHKYPVSGYSTLFGHSFGGLFGMYALLKEPGLFNSVELLGNLLYLQTTQKEK